VGISSGLNPRRLIAASRYGWASCCCFQPRYLELELTETVLMSSVDSTSAVLQALNSVGIRLAVDDFGTGYSSLSYLKRFPIDTLKIDQSFVQDVTTDASDATIVGAVIAMGKSLKQRVVAEGVETGEQLAFLRSRRCDEGQGYYFSQPVPADDFATLLATGVTTAGTLSKAAPLCARSQNKSPDYDRERL
jgi:diguanylate cyclase